MQVVECQKDGARWGFAPGSSCQRQGGGLQGKIWNLQVKNRICGLKTCKYPPKLGNWHHRRSLAVMPGPQVRGPIGASHPAGRRGRKMLLKGKKKKKSSKLGRLRSFFWRGSRLLRNASGSGLISAETFLGRVGRKRCSHRQEQTLKNPQRPKKNPKHPKNTQSTPHCSLPPPPKKNLCCFAIPRHGAS